MGSGSVMDEENVLRLPGSNKGPQEVSGHESKGAPVSMNMHFSPVMLS